MADDVILGFKAEGVPQTKQEIEALQQVLQGLNSGSSPAPQGSALGSTLPAGAPLNVPRLGNGLDPYNSSPGISVPPPVAATPTLTPYTPPTAPPGPGVYAPSPYGGATPTVGHGQTVVHASNVTVVANGAGGSPPISVGGNGGGYGAIPPGAHAPPPPGGGGGFGPTGGGPFSNWNPFGGGGGGAVPPWFQRVISPSANYGQSGMAGFMAYPGLARVAGAAGIGLTIAAGIGEYGLNYATATYAPVYQNETAMMAAAAAGHFIAPAEAAGMSRTADLQSQLAGERALLSPLSSVPIVGRLASSVYNLDRGMDLERQIALSQAQTSADVMRMRLGALGGASVDRFSDDPFLQTRYSLSSRAGFFGRGAVQELNRVRLDRYAVGGFGDTDVQAALGAVYSAGSVYGNTSIFHALNGSADPGSLARQAGSYFAGVGDVSSVQALQPMLMKVSGLFDSLMVAAQQVFQSKAAQAVAESNIGIAGSNVSLLSATGAGFRTVASAQRAQSGLYGADIRQLQYQLQAAEASGNPNAIAEARARLLAAQSAQAQTAAGAVRTYYTGRGVEIQATQLQAENLFQTSMYGGTPRDVNFAFEQRRESTVMEARLLESLANQSITPPEQRRLLLQQAQSLRQQARIGLGREQQQFNYSVTQGQIGVAGALATERMTSAELFGSPSDIYAAAGGQVDIMRQSLGAVQGQLRNNPFLSATERLSLQQQEIDLRRQLNQALTENLRNFDQLNIVVSNIGFGIAQTRASGAMQFLGVGGSGAAPYVAASASAAAGVFRNAQKYVNDLRAQGVSPDSQVYQNAVAQMETARNQALSVHDSLASVPFSAASRDVSVVGNTQLNVLQNTFAGWGDIRGVTAGLLRNVGQQMSELQANRSHISQQVDDEIRQGLISPADRQRRIQELNLQYDQTASGLVNQAVGYQNTLQNGWMDRLISQSINMPGRGSLVATQFTAMEAAPFMQAITGAFGFAGPSGLAARDYYLHRGDRLANTLIGNVTRPEGFLETAMSGAVMPDGTPMHTSPSTIPSISTLGRGPNGGSLGTIKIAPIEIIVKDSSGREIGRGKSNPTVHNLANGSLTLVAPPHASVVSRQ